MPFLRKLRVTAVFSVGLFACITSVVRLTYSIDLLDVPVGNATYLLDMDKIGLWRYELSLSEVGHLLTAV